MSDTAGIVKKIAVSTEAETVFIELICGDAYSAQVVKDDINSRLRDDDVFSFVVKVNAPVGDGAL